MKIPVSHCLTAASLVLLCGTISARADYSNTVGSLNPLAYWRFNETALSPALNKVTNASTFGPTLDGAVVLNVGKGQSGIVGTAIRFTNNTADVGYAGAKADVPFNFALNKAGPFSVEVWVKPSSLGSDATGFAVFSSMMNDFVASGRRGYLMYVNNEIGRASCRERV